MSNRHKTFNYDAKRENASRCGHAWCSDCRKRRGRNDGNRRIRRMVRLALRKDAD